MLERKSKIKEIEYYIQQVEMLSANQDESDKLNKIIALRELVENEGLKDLIAEDLKDETWIDATKILINTCNKRLMKSDVLMEHVRQCKNFMVFRYIEDKLLYNSAIIIENQPFEFKEVNTKNEESTWVNSKFVKFFNDSEAPSIIKSSMIDNKVKIDSKWMFENKEKFFTEDIFEDIDFLIKRKKRKS